MTPDTSRRALQLLLGFFGAVAVLAGASTVIFGVASIAGAEPVSGTVDSEMRFYAVWYVVAGLLLLRAARAVEKEGALIRTLAVALFVAGCSRALSWVVVGRPHLVAQSLMVVEFVLPGIILAWQARLRRRTEP